MIYRSDRDPVANARHLSKCSDYVIQHKHFSLWCKNFDFSIGIDKCEELKNNFNSFIKEFDEAAAYHNKIKDI